MPRLFLPPILLLLTALCWSLGGVLIKSIDWPPMAIAGGRSAIAIPMILLCIGRPRFTFSRAQVGGALGYAGTVVLFVFATRMTTAATAIFSTSSTGWSSRWRWPGSRFSSSTG